MKFITLILVLFSIQLNGQELSNTIQNVVPGKVYYKGLVQPFTIPFLFNGQLYKITPPVFETVLDTIFYDKYVDKKEIRVMIKESYPEWVVYEKVDRHCISTDQFVAVACIEKPARWRTINFNPNEIFKIIKVEKIKTPCTFDAIDNIENELFVLVGHNYITWIHDENTYIKTTAGKWARWREVYCSGCRNDTVNKIQEKLKEKGYYHGPINNSVDKETKAALTKFIQDNNLPIHAITGELLKILEVEY